MVREHKSRHEAIATRGTGHTGGIEGAVAHYGRLQKDLAGVKSGGIDIEAFNQGLVKCHAQVMKHSRAAYIRAIDIEALEETMKIFLDQFPALHINLTFNLHNTHVGLSSGLDFYKRRLHGIEAYAYFSCGRGIDRRRIIEKNMYGNKGREPWCSTEEPSVDE